jgi:hypothetical protein
MWLKAMTCLLIVCTAVITYLPTVHNFFISDDFVTFTVLRNIDTDVLSFFEMPSEIFRVTSYVYFWVCFHAFGAVNAEPYYWLGIALHALVSLLVCAVVLSVTKEWTAASVAGIFFAGYERHHEAVMWISAINDTIVTFSGLVFLLAWQYYSARSQRDRALWLSALVLAILLLALFSKEGGVVLFPLVFLRSMLDGASLRLAARKTLPILVICTLYGCVWISQAQANFFVTKGLYAFSLHFFPVYVRTLVRLFSPAIIWFGLLFVVAWAASRKQRERLMSAFSRMLDKKSDALFFAAFLVLGIIPYSFLTYLDHVPSRNTYLASVGLAGLIGVLFSSLYASSQSGAVRAGFVAILLAVVTTNVAYVWIKKEPQFIERAAPTRELIEILNDSNGEARRKIPITICRFPLDPWVGTEAIAGFTDFKRGDVVFRNECESSITNTFTWDETSMHYKAEPDGQTTQVR